MPHNKDVNREKLRLDIEDSFDFSEIKELFYTLVQIEKYQKLKNHILENSKTTTEIIINLIEFIARHDDSFDTLIAILKEMRPHKKNAVWFNYSGAMNEPLPPQDKSLKRFIKLQPTEIREINRFFAGLKP